MNKDNLKGLTSLENTEQANSVLGSWFLGLGIRFSPSPEPRAPSPETGFTLIEVLVVAGLVSFILASIFGISATLRRSWLVQEALLSGQQEARLGIERLAMEVRLASSVNVAGDNSSIRFNIPFDADGDGFLELIPGTSTVIYGADDPGDVDGDGALWEQGWNIEYAIDSGTNRILRRVYDNTDTLVAGSQRIVVGNNDAPINPDVSVTYFTTATGGTGLTDTAVNIGLGTQVNSLSGTTFTPALEASLERRVDLRN